MLVHTASMTPGQFQGDLQLQVYNGIDCCVTLEVHQQLDAILASRSGEAQTIYQFERALQGPALEMMLRGWAVDEYARQHAIARLRRDIDLLQLRLNRVAAVWWGKGLNPASPAQMKDFFYGAMGLPEQWQSKRGERKLSLDRSALEDLQEYFYALPIIQLVLDIRDLNKQLATLLTRVDPDGRMRTSYNIAGTETGRWSSSKNSTGDGGNLQNVTPDLRYVFTADHGKVLFAADLEQAESRECGWIFGTLFGDWTYLDRVEGDDIHTFAASRVWPHLGWSGELRNPADRRLAEQPFYRQFSYRDMSKRAGHLSNYKGSAWTASRNLKLPLYVTQEFQNSYFRVFPSFLKWWQWTAQQIQTKRQLVSNMGRTRTFFGRPNDDTTLREAIAYNPQSSTGDRTNLWLYRVWRDLGTQLELLHQNHDALYWQSDLRSDHQAQIEEIQRLLYIPLHDPKSGRTFSVPCDLKWGYNWGAYHVHNEECERKARAAGLPSCPKLANPNGLRKWKGRVDAPRVESIDLPL